MHYIVHLVTICFV